MCFDPNLLPPGIEVSTSDGSQSPDALKYESGAMPNRSLVHGGYSQDVPDGIYQLEYAGGGNGSCGGYIEALEVDSVHGSIFLLHEHITDKSPGLPPSRFRWRRFDSGGPMLDAWAKVWSNGNREGFTAWSDKPFWEAVDYNDTW
jgi:hypothetical protein